jgi:mannose/fructose/N-acetylgalactosamine-specific phosphotransferase system component IIC
LIAGLVQGTVSGALTLGLKQSVDWLRPRMRGPLAYIVPPLIAGGCSALLLMTAHGIAGTPEIWTTIAVPLAVSFSYILIYNVLRQHHFERTPHA